MGNQLVAAERPLTERYVLDRVLARGGVGEVWRARDLRLGRDVAVKVLHGAQADPNFRSRFRAEAQHAARLSHPNIAAVFDYGEQPTEDGDDPTPFLVMELVEGESLADLLNRRGRLGVGRTLSILRQLSSALAAAHAAGVVHRDVKPANVLVRTDGVVKITDFGIAASAASAALTETGQVVGTARYLSPEQARGLRGTPASDVYALGLVGYECLAGRPAFDGPDPVEIAMKQVAEPPPPLPPDVPEPVRGLVGTATAKDPARRLPDGAALCDALDRLLESGRRAARATVPPPLPLLAEATRPVAAGAVGAPAPGPVPGPVPGGATAAARRGPRRPPRWVLVVGALLLSALATVFVLVGMSGAAGSAGPLRAGVGAGGGHPADAAGPRSGAATTAGSGGTAGWLAQQPAGASTPAGSGTTGWSSGQGATAGSTAPSPATHHATGWAAGGATPHAGASSHPEAPSAGAAARSVPSSPTPAPAATDRGTAGTGATAGPGTATRGTAAGSGSTADSSAAGPGAERSAASSGSAGAADGGSPAAGSAGSGSTGSGSTGSGSAGSGSPSTGPTDAGTTGPGTADGGTADGGTGTGTTGTGTTGTGTTGSGTTGSGTTGSGTAAAGARSDG